MSVIAERRVPGVYFLPPPARRGLGLPPLDVAAFVGFAEKGPVDLPVPLVDINTYRAIFGGDLPLARDEGGVTVYANLPQSVASFFANGGRRCYVVRVVGEHATPTRVRVPGLVALERGQVRQASIRASSPGRWSERFRLGARLDSTPLPLKAFTFDPAEPNTLLWDATGAPSVIQSGDLLRLTFRNAGDTEQKIVLFPVTGVQRPVVAGASVLLTAERRFGLVSASDVQPSWFVEQVSRLTADGATGGLFCSGMRSEDDTIALSLDLDDDSPVRPGDILVLDVRLDAAQSGTFLFHVAAIQQTAGTSSPLAPAVEVRATSMLRVDAEEQTTGSLSRVERLRFELALREGDLRRSTLTEMAFNAPHPRFWGDVALLESSTLQPQPDASTTARTAIPSQGLETAAARAARLFNKLRTPARIDPVRDGVLETAALAGLLAPVSESDGVTYLPLDMPGVLTNDRFIGPDSEDAGKDGLDRFDASSFRLFVDDELAQPPTQVGLLAGSLIAEAFDRYYVQNIRLRGLHSLIFEDEVALVALPEAVHRNWTLLAGGGQEVVLPTPEEPAQAEPCPPEGPFALCLRPPTISAVAPATGPLRGGTSVTITGDGFDRQSETVVTFDGSPAYDVRVISATELRCVTPTAGIGGPVAVTVITPIGTGSKANAFTYLAESSDPALPDLDPMHDYSVDPEYSPLLPLQRELLRVCQARADMVGILTLPLHFEKRACIDWQQQFREFLGLPRRGSVFNDVREIADLSYAAVYHPWLLLRDAAAPGGTRPVASDGAVCGVIATRERERQVWVAPANLPISGALGLLPAIPGDDWADLFDLQFNLIRPEPRDFRVMSAHTLSDEAILLQLSVRRLMILLRKVAYLRGLDFVFESNHERFREGVRAVLGEMLRFMFDRGAFAGRTPQESYRVITDESVNTPQSIDQGRFIALIQVAPSQPAEFITVMLTRIGDQLQALEA